jgi:hypothetical protein
MKSGEHQSTLDCCLLTTGVLIRAAFLTGALTQGNGLDTTCLSHRENETMALCFIYDSQAGPFHFVLFVVKTRMIGNPDLP